MANKDALTHELSAGMSFASSMSGVSLFFTGIIISQYQSFDDSIRIPIVFLILSTFSFIFAAAIYSNAGSEITAEKFRVAEKYLVYAKNLVEILGLYLFILATPLILGAVTEDTFLKVATITIALCGTLLFSQSKFSVMNKELSIGRKRFISTLIVFLAMALYIAQVNAQNSGALFAYNFIAVDLAVLLLVMAFYFSVYTKQYKKLRVRVYRDSDADQLKIIMDKNLARAKKKHFSEAALKEFKKQASAKAIKALAKKSQVFVASYDGEVVGMSALKKNEISSVFSDPDYQRKGIGRMVVESAEQAAEEDDQEFCEVLSSVATKNFYLRLGYVVESEKVSKANGPQFLMRKRI